MLNVNVYPPEVAAAYRTLQNFTGLHQSHIAQLAISKLIEWRALMGYQTGDIES